MDPDDCDARAQRDRFPAPKRPWTAPKVIVSQSVATGFAVKIGNHTASDYHDSQTHSTS
jgi:hypothetical protein